MNSRVESALRAWKNLSLRERYLIKGMAVLMLGGLSYALLWQPAQQQRVVAERHYQQQLALAQRMQSAQAHGAVQAVAQPLPTLLSERAAAAGLDVQHMEVDGEQVRLTVSAHAQAVLGWLADLEREGVSFQALTLEKRDQQLEARIVI